MNEFPISKGDILTKVSKYELNRDELRVFIEVHKVLVGEEINHFIAVPTLLTRNAKEKYFGKGESEEEALKNCLEKIKDISLDEVIEKL